MSLDLYFHFIKSDPQGGWNLLSQEIVMIVCRDSSRKDLNSTINHKKWNIVSRSDDIVNDLSNAFMQGINAWISNNEDGFAIEAFIYSLMYDSVSLG